MMDYETNHATIFDQLLPCVLVCVKYFENERNAIRRKALSAGCKVDIHSSSRLTNRCPTILELSTFFLLDSFFRMYSISRLIKTSIYPNFSFELYIGHFFAPSLPLSIFRYLIASTIFSGSCFVGVLAGSKYFFIAFLTSSYFISLYH